jgi:hypothetical protein
MSEAKKILTPVGRIVAGDCFKGSDKDANGNPRTIKSGPNAGQPTTQYFIGLAIAKTDPGWPALEQAIDAAAREAFPSLFDAAGKCVRPDFARKIVDGDSQIPNQNNKRPCDKEGYPGHWVVSFSTSFAPGCYTKGGAERIMDTTAIKKGDYVRVDGSVKGNDNAQKPGVFLNHNMVEFCGHGTEIVSVPDAAAVFGGAPVTALPAGASEIPTAPTTPPVAGGPGSATAAVQPAPDFLNGPAISPAVTGAVLPTAPAPAPVAETKYLFNGVAYTKAQLIAGNHTEAMIASYPTA